MTHLFFKYFLVIFICLDRGGGEKKPEGDETENRKIMIVAIINTQNGCGFSRDKQHNS